MAKDILDKSNVECHLHDSPNGTHPSFELAAVLPTGNTLSPSNEAVALVVPYGNWATNQFHYSLLVLLRRLASADSAPWLAKTIYLISPTSGEISIHSVVDAFLESYAGSFETSASNQIGHLPLSISNAMIRNLLVLDSQPSQDPLQLKHEIQILSQGNLGVLPNMDLVFVTMTVFSRSPSSGNVGRTSNADSPTLLMHPYSKDQRQWEGFIKEMKEAHPVVEKAEKWSISLVNLALFCRNLFQGPYAPHALGLDRGIDSITIQGRYPAGNETKAVIDYVQKLEITLRGLSNLHERLHHSTTLYLLPSPRTFVKHEEYLVPNLLLLIPLVLRSALLGLSDIRRFDLQVMGWILLITMGATLFLDAFVAQQEEAFQRNAWLATLYALCFGILYEQVLKAPRNQQTALQSAQLIVCLLTIYAHVPICFGNVAISFPSAFFWAPWVALPDFARQCQGKLGTFAMLLWLLLTWIPNTPLASILGNSYPPYVRYLYFPIHLALSLSCALGWKQISKTK